MRKRMPSKWLTLIVACFGLLMLYIDLFIVNVALPTIVHDFRAPLGTVSRTISGYVRLIIEGVILQGFKLTALTCLILCGSAAVLAFFIRTRLRKKGITYPVQKEEQRMSVSPDG